MVLYGHFLSSICLWSAKLVLVMIRRIVRSFKINVQTLIENFKGLEKEKFRRSHKKMLYFFTIYRETLID